MTTRAPTGKHATLPAVTLWYISRLRFLEEFA